MRVLSLLLHLLADKLLAELLFLCIGGAAFLGAAARPVEILVHLVARRADLFGARKVLKGTRDSAR